MLSATGGRGLLAWSKNRCHDLPLWREFLRRLAQAVTAALLFTAVASALDTSKLKPRGYVNDFAGVLDRGAAQALEDYCGRVESATGAQIAIVTVDSLEDEPIEDVANRLFRQWGIGKKGTDEGLLLLLAIRDRKQRAEVGYGLEPIITDGYAGGVLRGIRPILQQGNYGGAMLAAAEEFGSRIAEAKGVTLTPSQVPPALGLTPPQQGGHDRGGVLGIIFVVVILVLFFRFISGGGGQSGSGGGGTGFLAGMLLGNLLGRRGDGFGGGGFGGYSGGGGGGGFGGFGGGDSGGGGASSGW